MVTSKQIAPVSSLLGLRPADGFTMSRYLCVGIGTTKTGQTATFTKMVDARDADEARDIFNEALAQEFERFRISECHSLHNLHLNAIGGFASAEAEFHRQCERMMSGGVPEYRSSQNELSFVFIDDETALFELEGCGLVVCEIYSGQCDPIELDTDTLCLLMNVQLCHDDYQRLIDNMVEQVVPEIYTAELPPELKLALDEFIDN